MWTNQYIKSKNPSWLKNVITFEDALRGDILASISLQSVLVLWRSKIQYLRPIDLRSDEL